jgi:hypothetical protein
VDILDVHAGRMVTVEHDESVLRLQRDSIGQVFGANGARLYSREIYVTGDEVIAAGFDVAVTGEIDFRGRAVAGQGFELIPRSAVAKPDDIFYDIGRRSIR